MPESLPVTYADEVAPYPTSEDEVTAETMARALACRVVANTAALTKHYWSADDDRQGARDFRLLAARGNGYYGTLLLLRALIECDPDQAEEVARQLWNDWEFGEPVADRVDEWLAEYGIDADRVAADVEPVERIPAGGVG